MTPSDDDCRALLLGRAALRYTAVDVEHAETHESTMPAITVRAFLRHLHYMAGLRYPLEDDDEDDDG